MLRRSEVSPSSNLNPSEALEMRKMGGSTGGPLTTSLLASCLLIALRLGVKGERVAQLSSGAGDLADALDVGRSPVGCLQVFGGPFSGDVKLSPNGKCLSPVIWQLPAAPSSVSAFWCSTPLLGHTWLQAFPMGELFLDYLNPTAPKVHTSFLTNSSLCLA